jgi:endonuclease YncB( thermonuclease family)
VKEILSSLIEGKLVKMEAGDFDKYGRILVRIYAFS